MRAMPVWMARWLVLPKPSTSCVGWGEWLRCSVELLPGQPGGEADVGSLGSIRMLVIGRSPSVCGLAWEWSLFRVRVSVPRSAGARFQVSPGGTAASCLVSSVRVATPSLR